jgi:hypothetical protein
LNESQLPKQALVATAHQHDAGGSGRIQNKKLNSPKKNAEKRTKRVPATGRPRWLGRPREKLPKAGGIKNGAAGL